MHYWNVFEAVITNVFNDAMTIEKVTLKIKVKK